MVERGCQGCRLGWGCSRVLKRFPLSGVFFGVSDGGLGFSVWVWVFGAARQGHCTVVGEDVAIEWIQRGIVDVGDEHAFAQVIEHDDARTTTQATKRFLMQLGPDARAGAEGQQAYGLAAVPERQHEQSRASVFARLRTADHRTGAVLDPGFFTPPRNHPPPHPQAPLSMYSSH